MQTLGTPEPWQTTQPRSALRDQSTHGFATSVYSMSVFTHRESLVSNAQKSHKTLTYGHPGTPFTDPQLL